MAPQYKDSARAWPTFLVVVATVVQEAGAAFAVGLFDALGPSGAVFSRFTVSAVILCVAVRPRLRGFTVRSSTAVCALALALASMNLCFYEALSRIPLGVAVTIEICGPLLLSVCLNRRLSGWIWALIAFTGVAILGLGRVHLPTSSSIGMVFAAGAAISWAAYILATAHAGKVFANLDALALATALGAVLTSPLAIASTDRSSALRWPILAVVVTVALMCSVIPYTLELISLRTIPASIFAVLTSLSPAVAAIAGWIVLGQRLSGADFAAVALVVCASIGAVWSSPRRPHVAAIA